MFDLPLLVFKIAIADLINLAADTEDSHLRRRDLDVIRQLVAAALKYLQLIEGANDDELIAAAQIRDLALKTLTKRLEAIHTTQQATPGHRLSNLDLAAMALYRRTLKLSAAIADFDFPNLADQVMPDSQSKVAIASEPSDRSAQDTLDHQTEAFPDSTHPDVYPPHLNPLRRDPDAPDFDQLCAEDPDIEHPETLLNTFPLYRESPLEFVKHLTDHCRATLESGKFGNVSASRRA